jgi:MFS family permease
MMLEPQTADLRDIGWGRMTMTESAALRTDQDERRGPEAAHGTASAPPLRANRALRGIYAGTFTAFLGLAMADVVFPLLVLGFTGKPLLAGLFGAIQFTAVVLVAIPAGNVVDRHDRRRVFIAGETTRTVLATALAVTLAAGHVWLVEIYLIAFVLGACQPLSGVRALALRSIAGPSQLTKALSFQAVVSGVAQLVGPAVGTALYAVNRSLPFVAIAVGVGISAICAYAVHFDSTPEPPAPASADTGTEPESPFAGLQLIWRHPVMRGALLFAMLVNLIGVPLDLMVILQAKHEGVPTHYIGLVLAALAAGGILGAPCIPRLHALLRPGHLLIALASLIALSALSIAVVPLGGFWMAGWLAAIGFVIPAAAVLIDVLILRQVPDHQRGRVLSATMAFMALGSPLGAVFGGSLLQVYSPATVLLGAAAANALIVLFVLSQRALRSAEWPPTN